MISFGVFCVHWSHGGLVIDTCLALSCLPGVDLTDSHRLESLYTSTVVLSVLYSLDMHSGRSFTNVVCPERRPGSLVEMS